MPCTDLRSVGTAAASSPWACGSLETSLSPWASWRVWALAAALGGCAIWLAGCASRVPLSPAPPPVVKPGQPVDPVTLAPAANWAEYRVRAAHRLVAANGGRTYLSVPRQPLLAIPVLEVNLNADGSVARIDVMRHPSQARDTTQLAIEAVHRAAPFGDVSRLPKPWKFVETFLFEDDRRFKPMTLDQ